WLYLLFCRGGFWREYPLPAPPSSPRWPDTVAVIPARNEAETIGAAVTSLLCQRYPGRFTIVLVDDHSTDDTARVAREAAMALGAGDRLTIVAARALPQGWTGKLWAVAEGVRSVEERPDPAELILLTDADIAHHPDNL